MHLHVSRMYPCTCMLPVCYSYVFVDTRMLVVCCPYVPVRIAGYSYVTSVLLVVVELSFSHDPNCHAFLKKNS